MLGLKELILQNFYFGKGVMVKKELISMMYYFGRVWWSLKNCFVTVSYLGGCGGHEITDI